MLRETQAQVAKWLVHLAARLGLASETEGLLRGGGLQVTTGRDTCRTIGEMAMASDLLPPEAGSSRRLTQCLRLPRGQWSRYK